MDNTKERNMKTNKPTAVKTQNGELELQGNFKFYTEQQLLFDPLSFKPSRIVLFYVDPSVPQIDVTTTREEYYEMLGERLKQDFINAAKNDDFEEVNLGLRRKSETS